MMRVDYQIVVIIVGANNLIGYSRGYQQLVWPR